jgi:type I restriction enzyme, S subunit
MTPSGWRTCRLSELAEGLAETCEPFPGDGRPYVALEHIAQGEPRLLGWDRADKATSTKALFQAGDVLFGKLRPNLRKAVLAPFDGVCSTDILVLRPRAETDSTYLQYVAHWPPLQEHAIKTASGTKMPRTSWRLLEQFSLAVPPRSEQEKIANIISSVDEVSATSEAVIDQLRVLRKAMLCELLLRGLPRVHGTWKRTELGELPATWQTPLLDEVAKRGSGHTPNKTCPAYWNGRIKWVSLTDSPQLDHLYIQDTSAKITPDGIANSSAVEHPPGVVILSRDGSRVGKSAITTDTMAVSQHFIAWLCGEELDNHFLYYWLQYKKPEFARVATGSTTNKTIGLPYFRSMRVPLPPLREQQTIAGTLRSLDFRIFEEEAHLACVRAVRTALISVLLTGEVRVKPDGEAA